MVRKYKKEDRKIFLYVGKEEQSDDIYDKFIYYNSSLELYNYFKKNHINTRLCIDPKGVHNEETWGNHIQDFINYMYYDDILYKL